MAIKFQNFLKKIIYLAILSGFCYSIIILLASCFQPLRTDDSFWHLKTGEIIVGQKQFPDSEPFLFTASPKITPIYHEWLFQVLIFLLSKFINLYFLRFFHLIVAISLLIIVWKFSNFFLKAIPEKAVLLSLFIMFSYQRLIQLRPHILSILFFYILLIIIINGKTKFSSRGVFLTALISVIWCNFHSVALIIFPFWAGFILSAFFYNRFIGENDFAFDYKGQIKGFITSILSMLLNPLGYKYYVFYLIGNKRNPYKYVIDEWGKFNPFLKFNDFLPLSSPYLTVTFLIIAVIVLIFSFKNIYLYINNKKSEITFEFLYLSVFSILSIGIMYYAVRFTWLIVLPVIFIIVLSDRRTNFSNLLNLSIYGIISLTAIFHFNLETVKIYSMPVSSKSLLKKYIRWKIDEVKYHYSAINFLKENKIKGNIFNPYYLGGALSYYLYPDVKIFFDGRFEHYSKSVNIASHNIQYCMGNFEEIIKFFKIKYFFIPLEQNYELLRQFLKKNALLIYMDNTTEIYEFKRNLEKK